jgi:hypothetical protein
MPADPSGFLGEPPPPWRVIAERKIQAWVDDGGPERLTNKGQTLDLSANPFVPAELRMAFDVLRNADAAPPWIEIGGEIEALLARAREEGHSAVSLSVEADSPAVAFYERNGFEAVRESEGGLVMRRDL